MMQVANYTQDLNDYSQFRNNGRGACGIKQIDGSIAKRKMERIVRDAKRFYLDGFGIDWTQYGEPEATFHDMMTCQLEWTHKTSGRQVVLTYIWWDDRTGAILQAGTQYGSLTL